MFGHCHIIIYHVQKKTPDQLSLVPGQLDEGQIFSAKVNKMAAVVRADIKKLAGPGFDLENLVFNHFLKNSRMMLTQEYIHTPSILGLNQ